MAVVGSLSVKLGLVTVEWDKATAQAKKQAQDLQKSFNALTADGKQLYQNFKLLGGGLSAGALGFAELMHATLEYANTIKDLSKGFDVSIAKTLQFRDAIQTSGGNAEGAARMMSTLFGKIDDAQRGNEQAIATFERLGITFQELKTLSPEQSLDRIFQGLSKITSTYEKVKLVKELLGRTGIGVSVDEVAEKLGMSTAKYKQHEIAIARVAEVSDSLKTTLDNLKIAFADMISPFTREGTVSIEKFKASMLAIASVVVVSNLIKIVEAIILLNKALKETAALSIGLSALGGLKGVGTVATGVATYFGAKYYFDKQAEEDAKGGGGSKALTEEEKKEQAQRMEANRREIISAEAKVKLIYANIAFEKELNKLKIDGLSSDKYGIDILTVEVNRRKEIASIETKRLEDLNKENLSQAQKGEIQRTATATIALANQKAKDDVAFITAQREKELKIIGQQVEFQRKMETFDVAREALDRDHFYMRERDYQIAVLDLDTKKKIAELEQQIVTAKQNLGEGATYEAEKARIKGLMDTELTLSTIRKQSVDEQERQRTSFVEGWDEAYRKFTVMSEDAGRLGSEMFSSFVGNMNSAIDEFVRTGKLGFADFAKSVIQSILSMILKFQALQIAMAGLRAMGFNPFGSMGGGVNTGTPTVGGFGGGGLPRMAAEGGDINGPTIVGEKGPELFIPARQGTVIPNSRISSMMGQGQTINYNAPYIANLSAIDTQSATQFLAKNKETIWAVNQSASRSMPTSR